jgi:predicted RNA binding protein YcfA (HicA-like mRNA interferase family)
MSKYSSNKDLNQYIRQLVSDGWIYVRRRKHGRLISPNKCLTTTVPGSPSDYRAVKNFKKDIQRMSYQLLIQQGC